MLRHLVKRGLRLAASAAKAPPHGQLAALQLLLKEKDASLERVVKDKDALVKDKEAALERAVRAADALVKAKDAALERAYALVKDKDAMLERVEAQHAKDLAVAQHAADTAQGRIDSRSVLEASLATLWQKTKESTPDTVSKQLHRLLRDDGPPCPGLLEYLRQAAEDNGAREVDVLRQARKLYDVLCERLHTEAVGGAVRIPAEVFKHNGRATLLAFAALSHFAGRNIGLYDLGGKALPVKLRALRGDCRATRQALRASALVSMQVSAKEIDID